MAKNKVRAIPDSEFGVCLWELKDDTGMYLQQNEMYLSAEGKLGDLKVEIKMKEAARHYLGDRVDEGRPVWISGARKITDMEHDDQMERLIDGKIPDPVDEARQFIQKATKDK